MSALTCRKRTLRSWTYSLPKIDVAAIEFGSVRPCSTDMWAAHAFSYHTTKATEPIEPDGLCRLEVRAQAGFVLTGVYRVAGSTRSRPGSRQPACGALKARTPVHYAKTGGHLM
jgi:hypothetical protein